jgi:hypothetical protein
MCILGGLREEENIRAGGRRKGFVDYNEQTSQRVETLMIVMTIMGLMGM